MALIANKTNVPIATGERIHTIQEFEMLLSQNAIIYARPSIGVYGGITGAKKISALAEVHGVQIVPHNPLSPVYYSSMYANRYCCGQFSHLRDA